MNNKKLHLMCLCASLLISHYATAQLPDLRSAGNFTVFTATGAFNNTGITMITGNAGTNAGIFTGVMPVVSGTTYIANAISADAAMDLEMAYNDLTALAATDTIAVSLGNNQVITPGIFFIGAAATMNDTLIFDAGGNAGAVFIIKIDGALATAALSRIVLRNAAAAGHIFWQVNGQTDIGESSSFEGNLVVNGAINLLEGAALNGRALSRAGAITLDGNRITPAAAAVPLPSTLIRFTASRDMQMVHLNWVTANEQNTDHFVAEQATDIQSGSWKAAGIIKAAGNSIQENSYSLNIPEVTNTRIYYRIKSVDLNGALHFSPVCTIVNSDLTAVSAYPNPTTGNIRLSNTSAGSKLWLIDVQGRILSEKMLLNDGIADIITHDLTAGHYFIKLETATGTFKTVMFTKQ